MVSSRLVVLGSEGIREVGPVSTPYRLPLGAASLREIGQRLGRPYMQGKLLIISSDMYNPGTDIWYEKPAGIDDEGNVLKDNKTQIHTGIEDPEKAAREFLGNGFRGKIEYKRADGVVGVYLWRPENDGELIVGIARNPKGGNKEGPTIGIGYIYLENGHEGSSDERDGGWQVFD